MAEHLSAEDLKQMGEFFHHLFQETARLTALDALIHFVDNQFTKATPMMWEHLDMRGGAVALHDIVRRGLRDRDERMARHDLS